MKNKVINFVVGFFGIVVLSFAVSGGFWLTFQIGKMVNRATGIDTALAATLITLLPIAIGYGVAAATFNFLELRSNKGKSKRKAKR